MNQPRRQRQPLADAGHLSPNCRPPFCPPSPSPSPCPPSIPLNPVIEEPLLALHLTDLKDSVFRSAPSSQALSRFDVCTPESSHPRTARRTDAQASPCLGCQITSPLYEACSLSAFMQMGDSILYRMQPRSLEEQLCRRPADCRPILLSNPKRNTVLQSEVLRSPASHCCDCAGAVIRSCGECVKHHRASARLHHPAHPLNHSP